MAENKTQPMSLDPNSVIAEIKDGNRRREVETLNVLLRRISGSPPVMWGPAMFGYGAYPVRLCRQAVRANFFAADLRREAGIWWSM